MELKENVTYNCESAGLPIRLQLLQLLLLLYYTATAITLLTVTAKSYSNHILILRKEKSFSNGHICWKTIDEIMKFKLQM